MPDTHHANNTNTLPHVDFYEVGYCTHPECMVVSGGRFCQVRFPAMAARIQHASGTLLFDTGYAEHFFTATAGFPEKLYALTTPVTQEKPPLCQQLSKAENQAIDSIFLSHFHADHIAGVRDFPQASLICSHQAYDFSQSNRSRLLKTKQGVLPDLLPDDFLERAIFIENLPHVELPTVMKPFTHGRQLYDGIFAIELPGHAVGHYGLWLAEADMFLLADAVWDFRTISENRRPNRLTSLIMSDSKAFAKTIDKLQILYRNAPHIRQIPSHCRHTLTPYFTATTSATTSATISATTGVNYAE